MNYCLRIFLTVACLGVWGSIASDALSQNYAPKVAAKSGEPERALSTFQIPEGMTGSVWAAEPDVANPVAFKLDHAGNAWVCETFRQQKGVEDNRSHMSWLEDDLKARSVADRLEYFKKHLGDSLADYAKEHDRIRLLKDTNGDGKVDSSQVFADGFNDVLDGTGAGVLHYRGKTYYTCIPHLWQLTDSDRDGVSDQREKLSSGYGVRVAFRGHDSHGLIIGPDGRIYFSIGDRGYNITTAEGRRFVKPYCGAVFRCELDGTDLEVYAHGLRNPQELAFDNYGNLFTCDNNSDSGDQARWTYVMPDSDAGWRMYYQYLGDRGPWNREKLWHPPHAGQAAYIVPPVANISDGPSGLIHYPGVGLPEQYDNHFFLCDFRGTPVKSGVRSFAVQPKGAGFDVVDSQQFLWQILGTDIDFDLRGRIYVSDWVNGWDGIGKGRIYRFEDSENVVPAGVAIADLDKLVAEAAAEQLVKLLESQDQRVRLEAQFELARRKDVTSLQATAINSTSQLARIHGIWGLAQLGRVDHGHVLGLVPLLDDADEEIRAQAAKAFGEAEPLPQVREKLIGLLDDDSIRVRSFAAMALTQYPTRRNVAPLLRALHHEDPWLRHAIINALVAVGQHAKLPIHVARSIDTKVPQNVRLATVVALRRLRDERVALYLADADPLIVLEAARAIYDEPISAGLPTLALLHSSPFLRDKTETTDALCRRIVGAAFRVGDFEVLWSLANRDDVAEPFRRYALDALAKFKSPPNLDVVLNDYRPIAGKRDSKGLAKLLERELIRYVAADSPFAAEYLGLADTYAVKSCADVARGIFEDTAVDASLRLRCLNVLVSAEAKDAVSVLLSAATAKEAEIRVRARKLLSESFAEQALPVVVQGLDSGTLVEQQAAVANLVQLGTANAVKELRMRLEQLQGDTIPAGLKLDLLDAAEKIGDPSLLAVVKKYDQQRDPSDPLSKYRECLEGGDAKSGRNIVFGRSDASCRRCHKVGDEGGEVGPNLSNIGALKTREYILEAVVHPNAKIAKGFDSVIVITDRGKVESGVLRSEDDKQITLVKPDGELVTILQDEIDDRTTGKSAMPELVKFLSKRDLRDIVEYLANQKSEPVKSGDGDAKHE